MINPLLATDFYKVGHYKQYPKGTKQVWSNWTPRKSRVPDADGVVHFGLQYFVEKYLKEAFRDGFFERRWDRVVHEYRAVLHDCLGIPNADLSHIERLHELGYLPLEIWGLPEGTLVSFGVPSVVITNTDPDFYWLPNYLETLMSNVLWKASTSATTARRYLKICRKYAKEFNGNLDHIPFQCHDFSMRGMSGLEDAILSGMGHLTCFGGTDTIPAILAAYEYYGENLTSLSPIGGSVPATEHSVMSAGSKDGEFETFKRLITEVYPTGIVSIVSDTWDLWKVCTEYLPRLKDEILSRDGLVVIRPDSGDPVKIVTGDVDMEFAPNTYNTRSHPAYYGVLRLLKMVFGETGGVLNKVRVIYGDSITPERCKAILEKTVQMGLSPANVVLGVGSYTYTYVTRDTYGFAMKATAVRTASGEVVPIWKAPVTDDGTKVSHKGIVAPFWEGGKLVWRDGLAPNDLAQSALRRVFFNGAVSVTDDIINIRQRVLRTC